MATWLTKLPRGLDFLVWQWPELQTTKIYIHLSLWRVEMLTFVGEIHKKSRFWNQCGAHCDLCLYSWPAAVKSSDTAQCVWYFGTGLIMTGLPQITNKSYKSGTFTSLWLSHRTLTSVDVVTVTSSFFSHTWSQPIRDGYFTSGSPQAHVSSPVLDFLWDIKDKNWNVECPSSSPYGERTRYQG